MNGVSNVTRVLRSRAIGKYFSSLISLVFLCAYFISRPIKIIFRSFDTQGGVRLLRLSTRVLKEDVGFIALD